MRGGTFLFLRPSISTSNSDATAAAAGRCFLTASRLRRQFYSHRPFFSPPFKVPAPAAAAVLPLMAACAGQRLNKRVGNAAGGRRREGRKAGAKKETCFGCSGGRRGRAHLDRQREGERDRMRGAMRRRVGGGTGRMKRMKPVLRSSERCIYSSSVQRRV